MSRSLWCLLGTQGRLGGAQTQGQGCLCSNNQEETKCCANHGEEYATVEYRGPAVQRQSTTLRRTSGTVLFCVAFVLTIANGSFSVFAESVPSTDSPAFPNCNGTESSIGDGLCDSWSNNADCGFDGGDCCECSCASSTSYTCEDTGFDCLDPGAGEPILGCNVLPFERLAVPLCDISEPSRWVVENTTVANLLADSMLCSGGTFDVEWRGYVSVNRTLHVIGGTVLDIVGTSDAVADGGGRTRLFSAVNGSLRVSNMHMSNGTATDGGAVYAAQQSEVILRRLNFSSSTADGYGGAIHLDNSSLKLEASSTFTGNSAIYGGAISVFNSSTFVQHVENDEICRFVGNEAQDGGAVYVSGGSSVAGYSWAHSTTSTNYVPSSPRSSYSMSSLYGSANDSARNIYTSDFDYSEDSSSTAWTMPTKTSFVRNIAQGSGGAVYMDSFSSWVWVGETTFEENSADTGGALFIGNEVVVEWGGLTVFSSNSARGDGGAVASATGAPSPRIYITDDVSFFDNECRGSGGALALFGDMDLSLGGTALVFSGNSADLFGGAIYISEAIYGHRFDGARFVENQAQNGGAVLAAGCGTAEDSNSGDEPKFPVTTFSNCTFVGNSALEAGGAVEITLGQASVGDSTFFANSARVGGAVRLFGTIELFNSSFIENMSEDEGGSAISNAGTISVMTGLSFSGNRFLCADTEYVDFIEGDYIMVMLCQGCYRSCDGCFVEDNTSVPICTTLFANAKSENGTATVEGVTVDVGYWRVNNQSENVLSCYNADACLGGLTDDPGFCHDGYEGPYCSVCGEGYASTLAFRCSRCAGENVAVIVVVLAMVVCSALVFVWHMVSIEQEDATRGIIVRVKKVLPLQSIKIVVVAWQIVTQFTSVAHVIYPDTYQRLLDTIAWVNFDIGWMLSAGCMVDVDFHDGLLVATIGPIIIIVLLGMTFSVATHRNLASEVALQAVRRKHIGTIILLTFFIYSSVSSAVFQTFACDEFDDGSVYLRADYRIECDSPRHKHFMIYAGVMIIVYPVGIPLFYAILLFRKRKVLMLGLGQETPRYDSTSSLREPYRAPVFYYEVVECSRRVLLTGAVVFIYPDTAAQIAVTIVVAFTFVIASEGLRPYESQWDTWVSRFGHVIVFLSLYVALLLKVDISGEALRDQNVFAGILITAHAIMISLVIVETLAVFYSMRNQETILPVRRVSTGKSGRYFGGPSGAKRDQDTEQLG